MTDSKLSHLSLDKQIHHVQTDLVNRLGSIIDGFQDITKKTSIGKYQSVVEESIKERNALIQEINANCASNSSLPKRRFRYFKEARECARSLNLRSSIEWGKYCVSGEKPIDIPSNPHRFYKMWQGWADFLGSKDLRKKDFRSFKDARTFAKSLKLSSSCEWYKWSSSGKRPTDIPSNPVSFYSDEWKGWGNFLGRTSGVSLQTRINLYFPTKTRYYSRNREYRSFEDMRAFAQSLKLSSSIEWSKWCKSNQRPVNIPTHPYLVCKQEWKGWGDFLGTGNIATTKRKFKSFEDARIFAQSLNLRLISDWNRWSSSGQRPIDIPARPHLAYAKEWKGYADFLGIKLAKKQS